MPTIDTGVAVNPDTSEVRQPPQSGGGQSSGGQASGGGQQFGANVPSSVDVRTRNAPEVDELRGQIQDLRGRIDALQERPTQQELDELRNQAERAIQVSFRLGARRVLRAINR